jgi:hypothetical protein
MTQKKFVEVIQDVVIDESIRSIQSNLINPPGRKPSEELILTSNFYNNLNDHDKRLMMQIVKDAVQTGVWGFFCVLDGVRSIENDKGGKLALFYENDGAKTLLNDPQEEFLHELL